MDNEIVKVWENMMMRLEFFFNSLKNHFCQQSQTI